MALRVVVVRGAGQWDARGSGQGVERVGRFRGRGCVLGADGGALHRRRLPLLIREKRAGVSGLL